MCSNVSKSSIEASVNVTVFIYNSDKDVLNVLGSDNIKFSEFNKSKMLECIRNIANTYTDISLDSKPNEPFAGHIEYDFSMLKDGKKFFGIVNLQIKEDIVEKMKDASLASIKTNYDIIDMLLPVIGNTIEFDGKTIKICSIFDDSGTIVFDCLLTENNESTKIKIYSVSDLHDKIKNAWVWSNTDFDDLVKKAAELEKELDYESEASVAIAVELVKEEFKSAFSQWREDGFPFPSEKYTKNLANKLSLDASQLCSHLKDLLRIKINNPSLTIAGTYDDFIDNYQHEIDQLLKALHSVKEEDITDEQWDDIDRKMKKYDKNVGGVIQHWISRKEISAREVAQFAIENQNNYGTETKQIVNAISDFLSCLDIETTDAALKNTSSASNMKEHMASILDALCKNDEQLLKDLIGKMSNSDVEYIWECINDNQNEIGLTSPNILLFKNAAQEVGISVGKSAASTNNYEFGFYGSSKSLWKLSDTDAESLFAEAEKIISDKLEVSKDIASAVLDFNDGRWIAERMLKHIEEPATFEKIKSALPTTIDELKDSIKKSINKNMQSLKEYAKSESSLKFFPDIYVITPKIVDILKSIKNMEECDNVKLYSNEKRITDAYNNIKLSLESSLDMWAILFNIIKNERNKTTSSISRDQKLSAKIGDVKGQEPAEKDIQRMKDLKTRAGGDEEKMLKLATNMANTLGVSPDSLDKAIRRAKAAKIVYPGQLGKKIAKIFMDISVNQSVLNLEDMTIDDLLKIVKGKTILMPSNVGDDVKVTINNDFTILVTYPDETNTKFKCMSDVFRRRGYKKSDLISSIKKAGIITTSSFASTAATSEYGIESTTERIKLLEKYIRFHDNMSTSTVENKLVSEINLVSDGTLATLTGEKNVDKLQEIRLSWLEWQKNSENDAETWQESWNLYASNNNISSAVIASTDEQPDNYIDFCIAVKEIVRKELGDKYNEEKVDDMIEEEVRDGASSVKGVADFIIDEINDKTTSATKKRANWWVGSSSVKKVADFYKHKLKTEDHDHITNLPFAELYYDYEEGLKFDNITDTQVLELYCEKMKEDLKLERSVVEYF